MMWNWDEDYLDIMPLSTLEAVGFPRKHVSDHPIKILCFGGDASSILGYINVDIVVGPIQAPA